MSWEEKKVEFGHKVAKALMDINAVKFGEFTLKSGKKSPYYIDLRVVPSFPEAFDIVTDAYVELIKNECSPTGNDVLVGVPAAGVPLASLISYKMKVPMVFVRKEKKDHGTGKLVEGVIPDGAKVIIIEDLISTGASNIETLEALRAEGFDSNTIALIVDRLMGGVDNCKEKGAEVHSIISILEMVKYLNEDGLLSDEQRKLVEDYTRGEQ